MKPSKLPLLLNHPPPYQDETLAGWVWRLTRCNYVESPSVLLDLLTTATKKQASPPRLKGLNALRNVAVIQGLGQLGGISLQEVYNHTVHHIAAHLLLPGQEAEVERVDSGRTLSFFPGRLSNNLYSPWINWCPYCLSTARYVRWKWQLPIVVNCDIHQCWLVEKCPGCGSRIREADIISGQCLTCDFPLTEAKPAMIPDDDLLWAMQSTFVKWLDGQPDARQLGLPPVSVGTLLHILFGLRYAAQRAGNGWTFHHIPPGIPAPDLDIQKLRRLTLFERGCLYATAFRGLVDWPQGFFSYLDAYRHRPGQISATGLRREFGSIHSSWLARYWKHPAFDIIQTVYNDYLVAHVSACHIVGTRRAHDYPDLLQRIEHLNFSHAARYLGVSTPTLLRLVEEGHLPVHHFEPHDSGWLSRRELDNLRQQWNDHLTIPVAANWLGIYPEVTWGLINEQLLRMVPASGGAKFVINYVYLDSLKELIHKLKKYTTIRPDKQQIGVSLADVCIRNGSFGLGIPQILKRICAGSLPACHPRETLLPLSDLWFLPETVSDLSNVFKQERDWLNLTETQACLGVNRNVVGYFVDVDLLKPVQSFGPKQFYRRKDVLALRDRVLKTTQAAALLGLTPAHISQLVHRRILSPISGPGVNGFHFYLFDRRDLLACHRQYVLLYELKRMCNYSA